MLARPPRPPRPPHVHYAAYVDAGNDIETADALITALRSVGLSNAFITLLTLDGSLLTQLDKVTTACKLPGSRVIRVTEFTYPTTTGKGRATRRGTQPQKRGAGAGVTSAPPTMAPSDGRAPHVSVGFTVYRNPGVTESVSRTVSAAKVEEVLAPHRTVFDKQDSHDTWGVTCINTQLNPHSVHVSRDWRSVVKLEAFNALTPERAAVVKSKEDRKKEARALRSAIRGASSDVAVLSLGSLGSFVLCRGCGQYFGVPGEEVANHACSRPILETGPGRDAMSACMRAAVVASPFHRQGSVVRILDGSKRCTDLRQLAQRVHVTKPPQGWAIPTRRPKYIMPAPVQELLSKYFDEGDAPGAKNKVSPASALVRLQGALTEVQLIGLTTEIIASYFGRRSKGLTSGDASDEEEEEEEDDGGDGPSRSRAKRQRKAAPARDEPECEEEMVVELPKIPVKVGDCVAALFDEPESLYFGVVMSITDHKHHSRKQFMVKHPDCEGWSVNVNWLEPVDHDGQIGLEGIGARYTFLEEAHSVEVDSVLCKARMTKIRKGRGKKCVQEFSIADEDYATALRLSGIEEEEEEDDGEEEEDDGEEEGDDGEEEGDDGEEEGDDGEEEG